MIYTVTILLLLTFGFSYGYLHSPTVRIQKATEINNEILKNTAVSGPIYIDDSNPSYDWSVAKNAGICIGDVVYFIIKNCTISNNTNGIFFHDVENGLITNNTILMNTNRIYLENSNYNNIIKNLI